MTTPDGKRKDGIAELVSVFLGFRPALERLLKKFAARDDVEDLLSEAYLRTLERFGSDDITHPKAFLYKTARNLALNYIARHEHRFNRPMEDYPDPTVYLTSDELESTIEAQEKFRIFCAAVEALPPKCRQAFLLKRVHGWSLDAIGREMGISPSTVEKHVAKGLLRCANALADGGYDLKGNSRRRGTGRRTS